MNILASYQKLHTFTIHPTTAGQFRKAFTPSGAKSDYADAIDLIDLLKKHPEKIKRYKLQKDTDLLISYSKTRRDLVDQRTRLTNQLTAYLRDLNPAGLELFDKLHAPICLDFLEKWPTAKSLCRTPLNQVSRFLNSRTSKKSKTKERIDYIKTMKFVELEEKQYKMKVFQVLLLVRQIKGMNEYIKDIEGEIKAQYIVNEDYEIINSIPGVGVVTGARLIGFLGNDRDRFNSPEEMLVCSEIAPVTVQSGKTKNIRRRYLCDKFTQLTFTEIAELFRLNSLLGQAMYHHEKKVKKKTHHVALRAIAYKLIRMIYFCWKNRVCFDEQKQIAHLKKMGSPVVNNILEAC